MKLRIARLARYRPTDLIQLRHEELDALLRLARAAKAMEPTFCEAGECAECDGLRPALDAFDWDD